MSDLEQNYEFFCPYCRASNTLNVDPSGGGHQSFVIDCETCCKPITVEVEIDWEGEVSYDVRQEDE